MILANTGVLITGGNQGLGKAIAEVCMAEGAHVLITARDQKLLEETRGELAAKAQRDQVILTYTGDVSIAEQTAEMVRIAQERLPNFRGLVNNAGVYGPKGAVEDVD